MRGFTSECGEIGDGTRAGNTNHHDLQSFFPSVHYPGTGSTDDLPRLQQR